MKKQRHTCTKCKKKRFQHYMKPIRKHKNTRTIWQCTTCKEKGKQLDLLEEIEKLKAA